MNHCTGKLWKAALILLLAVFSTAIACRKSPPPASQARLNPPLSPGEKAFTCVPPDFLFPLAPGAIYKQPAPADQPWLVALPLTIRTPASFQTIDSSGGWVDSAGGGIRVIVPAKAFRQPYQIYLHESENGAPIPGKAFIRMASFQVAGDESRSPITSLAPLWILFHYQDPRPGGEPEVYQWVGSQWQAVPSYFDPGANVVVAPVQSLSALALMVDTGRDPELLVPVTGRYQVNIPFVKGGPSAHPPVQMQQQPAEAFQEYTLPLPGGGTVKIASSQLHLPGGRAIIQNMGVTMQSAINSNLQVNDVSWRQDGAGGIVVSARISAPAAAVSASLWWDGTEFPFQQVSSGRYQAAVTGLVNGALGRFRVSAVDAAGKMAFWPEDCDEMVERVRFSSLLGSARNTRLLGEGVNSATGGFSLHRTDLLVSGPGMPLEFRRFYQSIQSVVASPLGFGWTHSYNIRLAVVHDLLLDGVVITYGDGRTAGYTADGTGFRSPAGDPNILERAGQGYLLSRSDGARLHFDEMGRLVSLEDRNRNAITLYYEEGNLAQITDTAGRAYRLEYQDGRVTRITDPIGRAHEYSYDEYGDLVSSKDPQGSIEQYRYDSEHRMVAVVDPSGKLVLENEYDARSRVVRQSGGQAPEVIIEYSSPNLVVLSEPGGATRLHRYDQRLRITEDRLANGDALHYTYDDDGNIVQFTDAEGYTTWFTYNARGKILTRRDASGQSAEFRYDEQDRLVFARSESGVEVFYEYDSLGNLVHTREGSEESWLSYDEHGLLLSQVDNQSQKVDYSYDNQGNLLTVQQGKQPVVSFAYDRMGRRISVSEANLRTVWFTYDQNDRISVVTDLQGQSAFYIYDASGNLKSIANRRECTGLAGAAAPVEKKDLWQSITDLIQHRRN